MSSLLVVILLSALAHVSCGARSAGRPAAERQIAERLSELEREAATLKSDADETRRRAAELRAARELLASGHAFESLTRLQGLHVEVATRAYVEARAGVERGGAEAFGREWQRLGGEIEAKERRLAESSAAALPSAALALAEEAQARGRPTYESGRLYGLNTTVADGLHYLGRASALLDFALFCRTLRFEDAGRPVRLRELKSELAALEAETLAAYRRSEAASREINERQALFNRANSTLKLAAEMDAGGRRAGALYKYLEATSLLGMVDAATPSAEEVARLREEGATFDARLRAAGEDHSLARLFWEPVRAALASGANKSADGGAATAAVSPEELRGAAVVVRRVLPAYFGDAPAARPEVRANSGVKGEADGAARGRVTVTLVRWPDT